MIVSECIGKLFGFILYHVRMFPLFCVELKLEKDAFLFSERNTLLFAFRCFSIAWNICFYHSIWGAQACRMINQLSTPLGHHKTHSLFFSLSFTPLVAQHGVFLKKVESYLNHICSNYCDFVLKSLKIKYLNMNWFTIVLQ